MNSQIEEFSFYPEKERGKGGIMQAGMGWGKAGSFEKKSHILCLGNINLI